jgi:hypothetical protein
VRRNFSAYFFSTVLKNKFFGRVAVYAAGLIAPVTFPAAAFESEGAFWIDAMVGAASRLRCTTGTGDRDQRVDSGDIRANHMLLRLPVPGLGLRSGLVAGWLQAGKNHSVMPLVQEYQMGPSLEISSRP